MSEREVSLAYLARQLLFRRETIGPVPALRRLIAVQAQYSPSPYIALAARLESFTIADATRIDVKIEHGQGSGRGGLT